MLGHSSEAQRHNRLAMLRQHLPEIDEIQRLKALYFMHAAPMCVERLPVPSANNAAIQKVSLAEHRL
jgi:hypothetical protein